MDRTHSWVSKFENSQSKRPPGLEEIEKLVSFMEGNGCRYSPIAELPIGQRRESLRRVIKALSDETVSIWQFRQFLSELTWPLSDAPFEKSDLVEAYVTGKRYAPGVLACPALDEDIRVHGAKFVAQLYHLVTTESEKERVSETTLLELADGLFAEISGRLPENWKWVKSSGSKVAALDMLTMVDQAALFADVAARWKKASDALRTVGDAAELLSDTIDDDIRRKSHS